VKSSAPRFCRVAAVLAGVLFVASSGVARAQCSTGYQQQTLNWATLDAGTPFVTNANYNGTQTINVGGNNMTVQVQITNTGAWDGSAGRPDVGPIGGQTGHLLLGANFANATQAITMTLTFRNSGGVLMPVQNIGLTAYDVDYLNLFFFANYRDRVTLSSGTWTSVGANVTGDGTGTATGTASCTDFSDSVNCRAVANSGTGAGQTTFTLTYLHVAPPDNPTPYQEIALSNVTFCVDPAMVPATISSVEAQQEGSDLVARWTTTMEKANAGFNLYGGAGDRWELLNETLIPSNMIDSDEPQSYEARFAGAFADQIRIEDVDIRGRARSHGPFEVGRKHGTDGKAKRTDVAAIQAENAAALSRAPMEDGQEAFRVSIGPAAAAGSARLAVTVSGIQRINHADLVAAGVNLIGVPTSRIGVSDRGRAVARFVDDVAGNGRFDEGDAIEFVATVAPTLYSNANVYVLTGDGRNVAEARTSQLRGGGSENRYVATYRSYPGNEYSASAPVGAIPWFDGYARAYGGPGKLTRTFDLPDLDESSDLLSTLTVDLWGLSDFPGTEDDHHVRVLLNGSEVADISFNGLRAEKIEVGAASKVRLDLKKAGNLLEIILPLDTGHLFDFVGLDGFSLGYPAFVRARDAKWEGEIPAKGTGLAVGGFSSCTALHMWSQATGDPVRLVGAVAPEASGACQIALPPSKGQPTKYWLAEAGAVRVPSIRAGVPTPVTRAEWGTEYLIITHPAFVNDLPGLVALQEGRGLRTQVVTTDAIYAAHSDHERDADAIQSFIRESTRAGASRLRFVLLVGSDSYDYYNVRGAEALCLVPTRYAKVGDVIHFAPTDVPYGDVDRDGLPDIPVGRLIARTGAELNAVIAKLVGYRGGREAVIVTGRSDAGTGFTDQHAAMSASLDPSGWNVRSIAVDDYAGQGRTTADARADLLKELGAGAPLVSYLGHSDYDYWDFGPLLSGADVAKLPAGGSPGLVVQWGCWNSYFVSVYIETMAHALLLSEGRGAAGVIGSSTLTDLGAHDEIGRRFFAALSGGPIPVGDALLKAQREVGKSFPDMRDDILALVLIGDPAMVIGR